MKTYYFILYPTFKPGHFFVFFSQAVEVKSIAKCLKEECFYIKNRVLLFCGHSSKVYAITKCFDESKQPASWRLHFSLLDFWLLVFFTAGFFLAGLFGLLPSWRHASWLRVSLATFLAEGFLATSSWAFFRSLDRDGRFQMHQCI